MSDSMLGRGADAAFATQKPCKHGTVLADLCGLCNTTNPDALDDLRDLLKTLHRAATPGECIQAHRILAALEAERRENAELIAIHEAAFDNIDGRTNRGLHAALGRERVERAVRDAKIRSFLEEARQAYNLLGAVKAYRARTNIAEALALLDGGAE